MKDLLFFIALLGGIALFIIGVVFSVLRGVEHVGWGAYLLIVCAAVLIGIWWHRRTNY